MSMIMVWGNPRLSFFIHISYHLVIVSKNTILIVVLPRLLKKDCKYFVVAMHIIYMEYYDYSSNDD